MAINEYRGKRVTVFGIGRSGVAAARLLREMGATVFMTDSKKECDRQYMDSVSELQIQYETGGHSGKSLDTDLIVVSPGVPCSSPVLREAVSRKISIIGEIELAYRIHPENWIAITGSNGKSTTTTMVGEILKNGLETESRVVGNIGIAASNGLLGFSENGTIIAELSSFQLETANRLKPDIAVVLNLSPDHLDRYADVDAYYAAKKKIISNLEKDDWFVFNAEDSRLKEWAAELKNKAGTAMYGLSPVTGDGAWIEDGYMKYRINGKAEAIMHVSETSLKGPHNIANQLAAIIVAKLKGVADDVIVSVLKNFRGLEHRMEFVRKINGVEYYNDSKATTMEAVKYALQSFSKPVHLIAGGYDKGSDFKQLIPDIKSHCSRIILLGEAAGKMEKAWNGIVEIDHAEDMESAVKMAESGAREGEIVLLSPVCASFDMFENFEERGRLFKLFVQKL